jgi:hypothetical protein
MVVRENDLLLGLQGTSNSREREQGDVAHECGNGPQDCGGVRSYLDAGT